MTTGHADRFEPASGTVIEPCPLCGGVDYARVVSGAADYEYGLPGDFHVSRCNGCGLLSQNPRPPFDDILRYYTEGYEPYRQVGSKLMFFVRQQAVIKPRLRNYKRLIGDSGRVLDVGCSTGAVLMMLKKHTDYELYGVEPVAYAAELARGLGLNVHTGLLEDAPYEAGFFNLIAMNHVLEHVPNPMEVVRRVYELLAPGGALVGEIPCADCIERRIFGGCWQGYHLPRHLTWFTRRQLEAFLKKAGFREARTSLQPQPSSWQVSFRNYLYSRNVKGPSTKLFSGHNTGMNLVSFPASFLFAVFGKAPIQRFTAIK